MCFYFLVAAVLLNLIIILVLNYAFKYFLVAGNYSHCSRLEVSAINYSLYVVSQLQVPFVLTPDAKSKILQVRPCYAVLLIVLCADILVKDIIRLGIKGKNVTTSFFPFFWWLLPDRGRYTEEQAVPDFYRGADVWCSA